jgi:hypothetical protein
MDPSDEDEPDRVRKMARGYVETGVTVTGSRLAGILTRRHG